MYLWSVEKVEAEGKAVTEETKQATGDEKVVQPPPQEVGETV